MHYHLSEQYHAPTSQATHGVVPAKEQPSARLDCWGDTEDRYTSGAGSSHTLMLAAQQAVRILTQRSILQSLRARAQVAALMPRQILTHSCVIARTGCRQSAAKVVRASSFCVTHVRTASIQPQALAALLRRGARQQA